MRRSGNKGRRHREGTKTNKEAAPQPSPKTRKGARAIGGMPMGFRRRLT